MATTIRVSEGTRDRIAEIARETHRPMNDVIETALDALDRRRFFDAFNDGYRQLRADDDSWREVERERALESGALRDGDR